MPGAVQKITLSSSRDIPFNKLVLSQSNVRRVKAGVSIEDLAASIARRGLLQGLNVRPVLDVGGQETGMFEVPAGGRRFRALELLVKQKRLAKTAPVPCVLRDPSSAILAEEDSLAENIERAPLHPLDQFRAFQDLRLKGQSEGEIAAAFFIPVNVVKQRLRLAAVAPALLDVYAEDGMTLQQLMAFSVSTDEARQLQVWEAIRNAWSKEPYQIRRMLTESTVRAADKRAVFVGLEAYEAAGGNVMRDLFQADDGGWLQDAVLLDRLVAEKLEVVAAEVAAEGWKWVEAAVSHPYDVTRGMREIAGTPVGLSGEERASIEALTAEHAALEAEHEGAEELPDAVDERLGEIETALKGLDRRPVLHDPADIARAGAFVSIDAEGAISIARGFVRPEDEAPAAIDADGGEAIQGRETPAPADPAAPRTVIGIAGRPPEAEDDEEEAIRPLPERLVMELTAHRTLALRDALASNPHVALTALLHRLVTDTFQRGPATGGCLEAGVRHVFFPAQAADLKDSLSARAVREREQAWKADLPREDEALWAWLDALDPAIRLALLAHCVSYGVNALFEKTDRHGGPGLSRQGLDRRLAEADRLARAVRLDMVEAGWTPSVDNYLGRVTKPRIVEAVREGVGEPAAQLLGHLKKAEMAKEAERLLAGSGWLPEPLRHAKAEAVAGTQAGAGEGTAALPAFLAGADDEESEREFEPAQLSAAE